MTVFIRLISEEDKVASLSNSVEKYIRNEAHDSIFFAKPETFKNIPGAPFAYWASNSILESFLRFDSFNSEQRDAQHGGSTKDDFRFLRIWWEITDKIGEAETWTLYAKGGTHSPFYADVSICAKWKDSAKEIEAAVLRKYPYLNDDANWILHHECNYYTPGLFQTLRSASLAPHLTPSGCLFGHNGFQAFVPKNENMSWLALLNSKACDMLFKLMLGRAGWALYTAGTMGRMPVPPIEPKKSLRLGQLGRKAWSLRRKLDTIEETSHAFLLPAVLLKRLENYDPDRIENELVKIQTEIDNIAFDLYGFCEADRGAIMQPLEINSTDDGQEEERSEEITSHSPADLQSALLSWAVGVAFGRFDWRLATGKRVAPIEPEPFDPLPSQSPGMLPANADPFIEYEGILVDDEGHPHDLTRVIEDVLARVNVNTPVNIRYWLRRNFFTFHLQRYSKSRRKAPIYWPLSTPSMSYTLWVYYPRLTSQTIYTAVNDYIEPKLKQLEREILFLRENITKNSHEDAKLLESLQSFELELTELRDALLRIASDYKPCHDDGVQITAAPLWMFFRNKQWQKLLKDTWLGLEKGKYDWSKLSMSYWPDRVTEKCKTDKSLAIAHGLESLYIKLEATVAKPRRKKSIGGAE